MSTFYSVQRRNSGKNANLFASEEDRMTLVGSNCLFRHPHGADPCSSACVHLSLPPYVWMSQMDGPLCLLFGWLCQSEFWINEGDAMNSLKWALCKFQARLSNKWPAPM